LDPRVLEATKRLAYAVKPFEGSASSNTDFESLAGKRLPFAIWRAVAAAVLVTVYGANGRKVLHKVSVP
jgi:hypothetical protein